MKQTNERVRKGSVSRLGLQKGLAFADTNDGAWIQREATDPVPAQQKRTEMVMVNDEAVGRATSSWAGGDA